MKYRFLLIPKIFRLLKNFKNIFLSVLVLVLSVILVYTSYLVKNRKELKESLAATITVSPGQSIQNAVNSAVSGDVIQIQAGKYNERINLGKSGITLQANGKVIMQGFIISGSNNTVRGFTISEVNDDSGIFTQGNNNLIENNEIFHTNQDGIWFFGHDNTFRGNHIHDILKPSISGDPHADCFQSWGWNWDTYNVVIEKNICNHNRTSGSNQIIMLARNLTSGRTTAARVDHITIRNNVFIMHDAGYSPITIAHKAGQYDISNIDILHNTFYNTTGAGNSALYLTDLLNSRAINNVYIGYNTFIKFVSGTIIQSNNVKSEGSGMVNYKNFDFHLTSNSPLINAGVNAGVMDDFDGTPRPQGSGYDIGAFEYKSGYSTPSSKPSGSPTMVPTGSFRQGDVNRDGIVNIIDFQLLSNSFGKSSGQSGFNANADFNHDNSINILDFQILSNSFGKNGMSATPTGSTNLSLTPNPALLPPPPTGKKWVMTWGDEFNGTAVDESKWKIWEAQRDYANPTYTSTMYSRENVAIGNGILTLTVNKKDEHCFQNNCTVWHGGQLESTIDGNWERRTFQYGYFEARIRYHLMGCGFWANFWLYSQDGDAQEFDQEIMTCTGEAGTTQRNVVRPCYHYPGRTGNTYGFPPNASYNDLFHTYGFLWLPDQPPVFYYDNKPYDPAYFNTDVVASSQRMWLDLRAGVGREPKVGGINPTDSQLPGIAEYDYVRVYELVNQ